ncbi:MarR family winged helix-turn-helix transcriptional regulator [Peristeroidobacter soli]|jgi:DNA-binding MarR family transcriptional regulator|uniref:MarR family winged helix-turn-helix transcriptional regulator n=1 Tax=Peristeroidobacter soli TaxID=2497877 RepID=UPI00101D0ECF|nr:MarR family winged helix-turn-helix transcriptional regulator [Peristeroidobacter soli]
MGETQRRAISHIEDVVTSWERERPDLDLSNFLLAICVMRLGRVLDDAYDRLCRSRFGVSGADMRVLFALRRAGKPYARRPTDLFKALLVTSGAITKQVDRLRDLGFVDRISDPSYSGGALIALTTKGLKATNAATDLLAEGSPIAAGVQRMSAANRAAVRQFVQQMLESLEHSATEDETERPKPLRAGRRRAAKV